MNQADIFWGKYCAGYVGVLIPVQSPRPCTWTDRGVSPKSCAKISSLFFFFFFFKALAQVPNPDLAKFGLCHVLVGKIHICMHTKHMQ